MWSLSLFLIISKARLEYSYFTAFVSLNSSLLPRSCTAVSSSKPNRTYLNVAFHLILKLAVVGYWFGEYQEGPHRWTCPTSICPCTLYQFCKMDFGLKPDWGTQGFFSVFCFFPWLLRCVEGFVFYSFPACGQFPLLRVKDCCSALGASSVV